MCLIAFAWQAHPDWPLVVAGNRDEFFARPTAAAEWWADEAMLAGRDLRAGGTWMGVTRSGRFAALTNYRDPSSQRPDAPSRGSLVGDFLTSASTSSVALEGLASGSSRFNGFNLLAAEWRGEEPGLWIVSGPEVKAIDPGVHALSNARLDTPWPKVDYAIERTREALASSTDRDALIESLFGMLEDRSIAADALLPHTGIALDTERALSAPFIRMPGYGTRASTILIVDRSGRATFIERRCEPDLPREERRFDFTT